MCWRSHLRCSSSEKSSRGVPVHRAQALAALGIVERGDRRLAQHRDLAARDGVLAAAGIPRRSGRGVRHSAHELHGGLCTQCLIGCCSPRMLAGRFDLHAESCVAAAAILCSFRLQPRTSRTASSARCARGGARGAGHRENRQARRQIRREDRNARRASSSSAPPPRSTSRSSARSSRKTAPNLRPRGAVPLPMEHKPRWAEMCARILQQCEVLRGGRSTSPPSWASRPTSSPTGSRASPDRRARCSRRRWK